MWFLLESIYEQLIRARERGPQISAEVRAEVEAASVGLGKYATRERKAFIPIEGVLTQKRDFFAALVGGGNTLYPDIIKSVARANAAPGIDEIVLDVGYSAGGNALGLFEAMDAIRESKKPVTAIVRNGALSAAYGIVSQANSIVATGRGVQFGSVGVAYEGRTDAGRVAISSTEAPKKRPDLSTDEGKAVIREQLDTIHAVFAETIAAGRGTKTETVNKNFGRGAVVLADQALKAGMIDAIEKPSIVITKKPEVKNMDLETLKSEHPAIFAEAVAIGVNKERDRISSHLIMGQASGDMETAVKASMDGEEMSAKLMATYQAAALNRSDARARVEDNPDTDDVKKVESKTETFEDMVAREFDGLLGMEV